MSLFGSLASGVSGLSAQSSAMGAISDNIANVNTTGYKATNVKFSTLVTTQTSTTRYSTGGVQSRPKQGVDIQGLLESTSNATDVGISGNGFFVVNASAVPSSDDLWCYTRAGSFYKDDDGYLKNTAGYYAMAWTLMPYDGTEGVSTIEVNGDYYMKAYVDDKGVKQYINDNIIDAKNLQSVNLATIGGSATATMNIRLGANLPSSDPVYDSTQPELGGQYSTAVLIYDSLGNSHNLQLEFTKETANSWGLDTKMPTGSATLTTYANTENIVDLNPDVYAARAQLEFSAIPANHSSISMDIDGHTYIYEFTQDGTTTHTPDLNETVIAVDTLTGVLTVPDFITRFSTILQNTLPSGGRFSDAVTRIDVEQSYGGGAITFDVSKCAACLQSMANPDSTTGVSTGVFTLQEIDWDVKNVARLDFESTNAADYLGNSITLGTHTYIFNDVDAVLPNGINVNISTAISGGKVDRAALLNLLRTEIRKNEPEPERFIASGTTLEIHPTASGEDILVSGKDAASVTFSSKGLVDYIGKTVTLSGVTYQFVNATPATGTNIAVDLASLMTSDGSDSIPSLVMKMLKNSIDTYYETTSPDYSMYYSVSNNTMVSTLDHITVDADVTAVKQVTFTETDPLAYEGLTITVNGTTYKFTATPTDPTDIDISDWLDPTITPSQAAAKLAAMDAGINDIGGGRVTATTFTGIPGAICNASETVTIIDYEQSTGINTGAAVADIAGKKYGAQSVDTSGTVVLKSSFDYNGMGDSQTGSVIPAVQFNANGTPKYINASTTAIEWANGAEDMVGGLEGMQLTLNFGDPNVSTGLTHLAGSFTTNYVSQDGAKFGSYSGVTISQDGIVTAVFDNGLTTPIAMIPLATFTDSNSLSSLSGNVWIETSASGQPTLRSAGENGAGQIVSNSLEKSTVDIAEEFTNMIVVQRAYSAAARIITTSDSMLEELINIKR